MSTQNSAQKNYCIRLRIHSDKKNYSTNSFTLHYRMKHVYRNIYYTYVLYQDRVPALQDLQVALMFCAITNVMFCNEEMFSSTHTSFNVTIPLTHSHRNTLQKSISFSMINLFFYLDSMSYLQEKCVGLQTRTVYANTRFIWWQYLRTVLFSWDFVYCWFIFMYRQYCVAQIVRIW